MEGLFLNYNPLEHSLQLRLKSGKVLALSLPLYKYVKITFHGDRNCIGYFDGEKWNECEKNAIGPQCKECFNKDIKSFYTIARKEGHEELFERFKDKDYILYLAVYGDKVKVGVTREERVENRLYEQGAMHYVELMRVKGIEKAYAVEEFLKKKLGLLNHVRSEEKIAVKDNLDKLREAYNMVKSLGFKLFPYVVKRNNFIVFEKAERLDYIDGKILSFRGNVVFFKNKNGVFYFIPSYHIGRWAVVEEY